MKRRKTAAELLAQLSGDTDYVARRKQLDEAFRRKHDKEMRAEAPIVEELRASGVPVNSTWDLVNTPNVYPQSLQILLAHLQKPYPDAIRDGIARAMAIPGAKFAWPILIRLYRQEKKVGRTQQGLAVALSNIADDEVMDDLIALGREPQLGASRALLLDALRRSRLARARTALMEFANDPLLQKEARRILRQLKLRTGK
jgi:hypothetical protein